MGIAVASTPYRLSRPAQSQSADREQITTIICILTTTSLGLLFIGYVTLWLRQPGWQRLFMAAVQMLACLISGLAFLHRMKKVVSRVYTLFTAMTVSMVGMAILADGVGIQAALLLLAYSVLVTSISLAGDQAERALSMGMISTWVTSLASFLLPQYKITLPAVDLIFPTVLSIFILVYVTLLVMEYIAASLRIRLILASLAIVLFPLLASTFFQSLFTQNTYTDRIHETLNSAVHQTAVRVDDFLVANRNEITQDATLPIFGKYLELNADKRSGSPLEKELLTTFLALEKHVQQNLVSYGLLDISGQVVQDFNEAEIGQLEGDTQYFSEAFRGRTHVSDIIFSEKDQQPYIYFSSPVYGTGRRPVGVLRAKYNAAVFQALLLQNNNLVGPNTSPILVDENYMRLGDAAAPQHVFQTLSPLTEVQSMLLRSTRRMPGKAGQQLSTNLGGLVNLLNRQTESFFQVEMGSTNQFVSVTRLTSKPWIVLYTQDSTVLSQLSATQERSILLFSCFLAGMVALFSTVFARAITSPITRLTETAQKISSGDLSVNAPVTNDEIGTMANAFNVMTGRLRQLINDLEDRVRFRTQELAERNETLTLRGKQIQTISEVARGIATTQDLETLLTNVSQLVSERFGFYHVGIFLIDENREFAVLRAANSEGGAKMLARQHKLKVGQVGIVGYVTGRGLPRIATDVGADSVYFNNLDLPYTRSEMALPLVAGGSVIGAIDVQSMQSSAFTDQDIETFTTLADQIAIAILNSRAFEDTKQALDEARKVNQRYLHQEWNKENTERDHYSYEYTRQGVIARDSLVTPEINSVLQTGEILIKDALPTAGTAEPAVMGVPIKLRGETIGIIHLQDQGTEEREWAQEEITAVQSIADQVAQALENARLFEQTVRRADRDRKVLEITSKIRSTNDPQAMLQIAVEELQRALNARKTQVILNGPAIENENSNGHHPSPPSNGNGNSSQDSGENE